jgi:hypothetical protein
MIVEVRTYRVKSGLRDRFIEFFETRAIPALQAKGMGIIGPLIDIENPDVFVFLRSFPSLEARDEMKSAFYDGPEWKNELEQIAMPMLDRYDVILTETSPGLVMCDLTADVSTTRSTPRRA